MLYLDIFIKTKNLTPYIFTISYLDMQLYRKSPKIIYFYLSSHKQRHSKASCKYFWILMLKGYLNKQ